jgi:hypothetical protein
MISTGTAQKLKKAGLVWTPALHDFFMIPERGMDDRVFVISDIQTNIDNLFGAPVVAFQGASEWALDYLVMTEAVWMPSEEQLRSLLEDHLLRYPSPALHLAWDLERSYRVEITHGQSKHLFQALDASSAYSLALLYLLENELPAGEG